MYTIYAVGVTPKRDPETRDTWKEAVKCGVELNSDILGYLTGAIVGAWVSIKRDGSRIACISNTGHGVRVAF